MDCALPEYIKRNCDYLNGMEETLGKGERQVLILNNSNLTKHIKSLCFFHLRLFVVVYFHSTNQDKSFEGPHKMKIYKF